MPINRIAEYDSTDQIPARTVGASALAVVAGIPYLRTASGLVALQQAGGAVAYTAVTGGTSTRIPYFDATGALAEDSSFFWDPTGQKLNILGGITSNNGPLLVTRRATGGNPVLATGISVYRNSQYGSGTPTDNDILNQEFLLQADDDLWYTVGGVGGKITDVTAASVAGGTVLMRKPAGAGDTTVVGLFLGPAGKLRVGDGNQPTAILEVIDTATNFVLSAPTLHANQEIGLKNPVATATPGNPTGTTSTTDVMMGLGSTVVFTPSTTGRVLVLCSVVAKQTTSGDGCSVTMYRGTGSAPANAAAVTGTQTGGGKTLTAIAANQTDTMALFAVVSGLTIGTQYWLDLAVHAVTGGTASVSSISFLMLEL